METTFDRVSYSYGRVRALTEVSFTVPTGLTVALLGPTAPASRPQWT